MATKQSKRSNGKLLTVVEAGEYAKCSHKYLNDLRVRPTKQPVPKFVKKGNRIFYAKRALDSWNKSRQA